MPTYDTPNFKGIYNAPVCDHGAGYYSQHIRAHLPGLTNGVALAAGDIVRLGWLPEQMAIVDAVVMDPTPVLTSSVDLGFGEAIADGYAFNASGNEIINDGASSGAAVVRGNNAEMAGEAIQEYARPVHLTINTVPAGALTEGFIDVYLHYRNRNYQDRI